MSGRRHIRLLGIGAAFFAVGVAAYLWWRWPVEYVPVVSGIRQELVEDQLQRTRLHLDRLEIVLRQNGEWSERVEATHLRIRRSLAMDRELVWNYTTKANSGLGELMSGEKVDTGILAQLPADLAYLAEPAMRLGVYHFDAEMDAFLAKASKNQMNELTRLAETVRAKNHFPRVNEWLDQYPMTKHKEAAHLYFMFGLMDAADLKFE